MTPVSDAKKKLQDLVAGLQKNSGAVRQSAEKTNTGDARIFKPKPGVSRVRFLPPVGASIDPWELKFIHQFKSNANGGVVTVDCPTSPNLGGRCKVCDENRKLWNEGSEASKDQARKFKRKKAYITNVNVRNAEGQPDLSGKVLIYRFGVKIFDKLKAALNPDVVGLWYLPTSDGADFSIVMTGEGERSNYDSSQFIPKVPLAKTEDVMLKIIEHSHDLTSMLAVTDENDPTLKKFYEEHVLGEAGDGLSDAPAARAESKPEPKKAVAAKPKAAPVVEDEPEEEVEAEEESEEDYMKRVEEELKGL